MSSQTAVVAPAAQTLEQALARIRELEAEKEKSQNAPLRLKVGEKGGIVFIGIGGKFPLTLYAEQYKKLDAAREMIHAFILANDSKLARKDKK